MRLLQLEIKRILKTKSTIFILIFALFLTGVMAYLPTTFSHLSYEDGQEGRVVLKGIEAIKYLKEAQKPITGTITPAKIREAVEEYQACMRAHNATEIHQLPEDVYLKKILPIEPLIYSVCDAFSDGPDLVSVMDITPRQAEDFYKVLPSRLENVMHTNRLSAAAQQAAAAMYTKVSVPFVLYPGSRSSAVEYLGILIFVVAILCVVIAAPVFAADYQTEADAILRCTRHGRHSLGLVKILSALIVCTLAVGTCMMGYIFISNSLFGWECTKTSVQMLFSVSTLLPLNAGELQGLIAGSSLVSFLAAIGATLFISSRCKSTISALAISLLAMLFPLIVHFAVPDIGAVLRALFPSGGIGLQNSYLYAMLNFDFANIGPVSLWFPWMMLTTAAIEVPLFVGLAWWSYTSKRL